MDKLGQFQFEIKNEAEKNPNGEYLSRVPTTTDEVVYQLEKAIDISNKIWEQAMKAFDLDLQKLKRKKFKKKELGTKLVEAGKKQLNDSSSKMLKNFGSISKA